MVAGDQQLVHTPFVPEGYWSPLAPLIWDPVKAPDIRFSSSQFRKQHPRHEKAVITQLIQHIQTILLRHLRPSNSNLRISSTTEGNFSIIKYFNSSPPRYELNHLPPLNTVSNNNNNNINSKYNLYYSSYPELLC
ncbi:unnamed protein product [Schistosoma margrebowiei]|uniref:Uncharacterized protein n=1 Tax=Schistosoma margrebowiei TaxID=48269 RepID=A0A183LH68_9TREM|nr:unnamed protein product [Schistosoma margrebowiei]